MRRGSIRWRLPLSYAAIALLAALALGVVLLTTLRGYYAERELDYLRQNASVISMVAAQMLDDDVPAPAIEAHFESISFLSQTRIRLYDRDHRVIADSGVPDMHEAVVSLAPRNDRSFGSVSSRQERGSNYESYIFLRSAVPQLNGTTASGGGNSLGERLFDSLEFLTMSAGVTAPADVLMPGVPFGYGMFEEAVHTARRTEQSVEVVVENGGSQPLAYVQVNEGPAYGSAILDSVMRGWVVASGAAVLLAAGVGWFVSRTISTPLLALTAVTADMAAGKLSARAEMQRDDEFGSLGRSFNEMATQIEHTIVTLRQFVADAAHELHTPLTALNTNLELAASEHDEAKRFRFIARAQEQLKRLETLTIDLLDLSRIEMNLAREHRESISLTRLVQETSEVYASRAEQAGVLFRVELPDETVTACANELQLRRVIGNLLDNAIKFTPEDGQISVGLGQRGDHADLWVRDTGIGIPPEDVPYLFNRFHRGRNAAAYPGSGLGLAIIKAIVDAHRGRISVESTPHGTQVLLHLPASV